MEELGKTWQDGEEQGGAKERVLLCYTQLNLSKEFSAESYERHLQCWSQSDLLLAQFLLKY